MCIRDSTYTAQLTYDAALLRADQALLAKQYEEAASLYRTILSEKTTSFPLRLDAWGGLLASDPQAALAMAEGLLAEVSNQAPTEQGRYINWFGAELWQAVVRSSPKESLPAGRSFSVPMYVRFPTDADWVPTVAKVMTQLYQLNASACLVEDKRNGLISLRLPIAYTVALDGNADLATEVINLSLIHI